MKRIIFVAFFVCISVSAYAREFTLKLSPGWGYLPLMNHTAMNLRAFPDLMLNLEGAVEATSIFYPILDLLYMHDSRKQQWFKGGLDMIGIGIGLKAVYKPSQYIPETGDYLDRARYWLSVAPGPFINKIASSSGGNDAGTTKVRFGIDVGFGLEYYFTPYWGVGGQAKMAYVSAPDDYIILNFGPSLCARF